MKKIIILSAFLIIACNSNPVPKPDRLLDEEQMKNILYDLAILQATESFSPKTLRENGVDTKAYLFEKYQIDSVTFYQNQRYYASDARKYKQMYQSVLDRINSQIPEEGESSDPLEKNSSVKKKDSATKSRRRQTNRLLDRDTIDNNLPLK
ncbi:DUF4296 domain-containing protein [Flavobacterium sp. NRK F10]|uniref:DUF4296 domain-containing protein n=1 Tax=Flavobacterium sediminis TaxID=2201181 RepID=A0A2U8QUT0_9FLAO|nr:MULTISPECIES: DUF4296 domain-containing protein [Flavobacterium]AWM13839.1 DUF4296 domain-containing protein [Flavobacterium sediminis]MCO6175009.1 DUF4296 domain-containing protein [Flavobacterium sp. NRK F10]